jgi:hypothetical protein
MRISKARPLLFIVQNESYAYSPIDLLPTGTSAIAQSQELIE